MARQELDGRWRGALRQTMGEMPRIWSPANNDRPEALPRSSNLTSRFHFRPLSLLWSLTLRVCPGLQRRSVQVGIERKELFWTRRSHRRRIHASPAHRTLGPHTLLLGAHCGLRRRILLEEKAAAREGFGPRAPPPAPLPLVAEEARARRAIEAEAGRGAAPAAVDTRLGDTGFGATVSWAG